MTTTLDCDTCPMLDQCHPDNSECEPLSVYVCAVLAVALAVTVVWCVGLLAIILAR